MPAYKIFGSGPKKALAFHSWFCDSSSYEPLLPYIDPSEFTFLFMDLRGYGVAKDIKGDYSVDESVRDAIGLVQSQNWNNFHIVGQSMGSLIAQKIALEYTGRVKSVTGLSPIPASGSPKTPELLTFLEEAAIASDANALECIHSLTNRRYSDYIAERMVNKWRSVSVSEARLAYLHMLCHTNFSSKVQGLKTPFLTVFGEHSSENEEALLRETFLKWYPNVKVETCKNVGHFLVQETPVHLASLITRFIRCHS